VALSSSTSLDAELVFQFPAACLAAVDGSLEFELTLLLTGHTVLLLDGEGGIDKRFGGTLMMLEKKIQDIVFSNVYIHKDGFSAIRLTFVILLNDISKVEGFVPSDHLSADTLHQKLSS
jgi:hypothetical protein